MLKKTKYYNKLLFLVTVISVTIISLLFSWVLTKKTDIKYLDNLYSFSQWSIPLSSRIMGDSLLYQHSRLELLNDFDPFRINPETPIFAKLLLAVSIRTTGNPYWFSLMSFAILLIVLNYIAKRFFKLDVWHRGLLLLLTGTSPILLAQISTPLVDLSQITLFIVHLYFLFLAAKQKQNNKIILLLIASGLALGAMTATKIAVYLPFILLLDAWYLWREKKLFQGIILVITTGLTYVLIYSPYIINNGLITWLKAQKWMLNFYRNSDVVATPGMILITAFTGLYKGWWGAGWERIVTWSGSWALGIAAVVLQTVNIFKTKEKISNERKYLLYITLLIITFLLFIPFWPRYFVFFVPLFWLSIISWLKDKKALLLLLLFPLLHSTIMITNALNFDSSNFISLWEKAAFKDLNNMYPNELWEEEINEVTSNSIYSISIKPRTENASLFNKIQYLEIAKESYDQIETNKYKITWKFINGEWIIQSVNELANDVKTTEPSETGYLCINPTKVKDWSNAYLQASELLGTTKEEINQRTMMLVPRDYCMPVGSLSMIVETNFVEGVEFHSFN